MSKMLRSIRLVLVVASTLLVSLQAAPEARAVVIPSGFDWFTTENASFAKAGLDGDPTTPGDQPVQLKSFLPSFNALFPSPDPSCPPAPCSVLQPPTLDIQWLDRHGAVTEDARHAVKRVDTLGPFPATTLFDTIVRRLTDVTPSNNNATNTVPIEMVYLSLRSTQPVTVKDVLGDVLGIFDLYVGLARDPLGNYIDQIDGRMRLTCDDPTDCVKGPADIGLLGDPDDPSDPAFLGLPVTFDVLFIPAGLEARPENVVLTQTSTIFFHGENFSPSGRWDVPGPPALLLLGLGAAILLGVRRRQVSRGA